MCLKDVVDICLPRRDNRDRFLGPPIIELELSGHAYNYRKKKYPTTNEKREANFMWKVPSIWIPQKVLHKQQETLQWLHRTFAEWWSAQLLGRLLPLLQGTPQDRRQINIWRMYERSQHPKQNKTW